MLQVDCQHPLVVIADSGCWIWSGATVKGGYGILGPDRPERMAHRASYALARGPIPEGLTLDHLCRNTSCVRPEHLEPVTLRDNILRGDGLSAMNARKTHCPAEHEYDRGNTYVDPTGRRHCKTCQRMRARQRRAAVAA